jgi:integrase
MASIHRDPRSPKGVWYAHYYRADGQRVARSTGTADKSKAKIICEAWQIAEHEVSSGHGTKDRITEILNETLKRVGIETIQRINVGDWLDDWLASKEQVSAATRLAYEQTVREFKGYLGELGTRRRLESITEADIRGFVAMLRDEGRSPGTINKLVRKYLSVPFEKARKLGRIKFNPVMVLDPEKVESVARHTFTPEQVAKLISVANRDWSGAILLAYGTGGRLQDIANLKWLALDLEAGVVTFTERKTSRKAVIGLHPDFVDWITAQSVPDCPESFVFPTLANRSGAGRNGLSKAFEAIMNRAGIKSVVLRTGNTGKGRSLRALSFHSFRHGAATAVFNSAALKEIARRVTNHAAGGVVDRYIHDDIEAIKAATGLIPRLPKADQEENAKVRF